MRAGLLALLLDERRLRAKLQVDHHLDAPIELARVAPFLPPMAFETIGSHLARSCVAATSSAILVQNSCKLREWLRILAWRCPIFRRDTGTQASDSAR